MQALSFIIVGHCAYNFVQWKGLGPKRRLEHCVSELPAYFSQDQDLRFNMRNPSTVLYDVVLYTCVEREESEDGLENLIWEVGDAPSGN